MRSKILSLGLGGLFFATLVGCDAGVPIQIRIDEFSVPVDLDDSVATLESQLLNLGTLPVNVRTIPETWPDNLPDIRYVLPVTSPPERVDLTPEEDEFATMEEFEAQQKKYADINKAGEFIERIELDEMVLRVEANSTNYALPSMDVQIADAKDAEEEDNQAWWTVGSLPPYESGVPEDLLFNWVPGGSTFLTKQIGDENKEFAVRARGNLVFDTSVNGEKPRGQATLRLIIVATFFVSPL